MKTKITLSALVLILSTFQLKGQDYHFSQYFDTPLLINPALTGSFNGEQRGILYYRNQWNVVKNPYRTFGFSFDARITTNSAETGYLSGGLSVLNDKAGTLALGQTQVLISGAYHQQIGTVSALTGGIQGGVSQRTINQSNMLGDNQYDPALGGFDITKENGEPLPFENFMHVDLGAGILYTFMSEETNMTSNDGIKFNIGVSFYHFHSPKQKFTDILETKMYSKAVIYSKGLIGLAQTNVAFAPSLLYEMQGQNQELLFGGGIRYMLQEQSRYTGNLKESALFLGCYYRTRDALIPHAGIEFANYAFGISYDSTLSGLQRDSHIVGGFEINIRYINPNPFSQKYKSFYK